MDLFGTTGQQRRQWLDRQGNALGEAMRYYLGPSGIDKRLNALASVAPYAMDGMDYIDAQEGARNLFADPSLANALAFTAPMVALAVPGVSNRLAQGVTDVAGDAVKFAADESGALRLPSDLTNGESLASVPSMSNPIFDKASSVASELRKVYGDAVQVSTHPSPYGNSAYLRVRVPTKDGRAYTETGFRLSDHGVGDRRKETDDFSTIIDDDSVTPEILLKKVQDDLSRGIVNAEALAAKKAERQAIEAAELSAQMDLWKSLDERTKSDFAAAQGPLAMSKQARPAARAKQYWDANAGTPAVEAMKAKIRASLARGQHAGPLAPPRME